MQPGFTFYYKRVFLQIGVDIKRHTIATAVTIISAVAVLVLQRHYNLIPPTETRLRTAIAAAPAVSILICYFLMIAIRAPWKLQKAAESNLAESEKALVALKSELVREKEDLTGCPQIILGYEKNALYDGFFVRNPGADAISVQLERALSPHYILTGDLIPYIPSNAGPPPTVKLRVEPKEASGSNVSRAGGNEAWNLFAQDLWLAMNPTDESMSGVDQFNQILNEMLEQQLIVNVKITYRDLVGKRYISLAQIVWNPLTSTVVEVRPGAISRCD